MHIGGLTIVEGPPPTMDEFLEQIRRRLHLVPRYRHKLAHTALDSGRPVWIDDPSFNLDYHVRHTALPAPGPLGAAAGPDRADLLPAARPLQAAVGDVADRGPRGRPLRADHQDPPLADRRDRGRGPRDGAVRPLPRAAADHPLRAPWKPHPEPGTAQLLAAGIAGAVAHRRRARGGRARRARASRARARARPRSRRGRRRDRLGGSEPRAGDAAERADRPAPALRRGERPASTTSRPSRTPSAAPSTTSCSRSSRARCGRS